MSLIGRLKQEIREAADPAKVKIYQSFFKTGKGEYGEGDLFLGVVVPKSRQIAKKYNLSLEETEYLLTSKFHEERLVALFILIQTFTKAQKAGRKKIYKFYLRHTSYINSWDLVDSSADKIVGAYLADNPAELNILVKLAKSSCVWERRVAIISTLWFIRHNQFSEALRIAEVLLADSHDLIQKAVGWMLREVGKRSLKVEEDFLRKHYQAMPRTMLRYAIERFPKYKRLFFLAK